jgi:lipopolysaccharide/colanic/teichoic acid biosynthesis glycosyltransferase
VLHPRYRRYARWRRPLDLLVAVLGLLLTAPLLGALWLLLRRDGPALYSQVRIGEHGRPFRLYKLRSMSWEPDADTQWTEDDDPRVTRIGRVLRASHIDELPQLWNVLHGDMTLVGPRPEQPHYVTHLEWLLPLYQRRHLLKPGLTGWAQIRCGYAGSELGAAWKLCHDLYYIKYSSLAFDLAILIETAYMLLVPHRALPIRDAPFVLAIQEPVGQADVPLPESVEVA